MLTGFPILEDVDYAERSPLWPSPNFVELRTNGSRELIEGFDVALRAEAAEVFSQQKVVVAVA
jgi:hypothetical protein